MFFNGSVNIGDLVGHMLFRLGSEAGAFSDKDRLVGDLDGNVGCNVGVGVGVHYGECGLGVDKGALHISCHQLSAFLANVSICLALFCVGDIDAGGDVDDVGDVDGDGDEGYEAGHDTGRWCR